jgi:hypothetical protein
MRHTANGTPGVAHRIIASMAENAGPGLPELPEKIEPDQLRALDTGELDALDASLRAAERTAVTAMSPYERTLREVRSRLSEVATELRRRERAAQVTQRATVRELAKSGGMPTLGAVLAAAGSPFEDQDLLDSTRAFLSTGGQVGFGFATRPGTIAFTDGRRQKQARTWTDARLLFDDGWEPGTPGIPGVRVHLPGSRVERVVSVDDVVVQVPGSRDPEGSPLR